MIESVFKTQDLARDNYLSRLFGIFSEDVVRHWCSDPNSRYADLGRPALWAGGAYRHTLDFTLRDRESGRAFVAELKTELAFENYRYLRLREPGQLRAGRRGATFDAFLALAKDPDAYEVRVGRRPTRVSGSILIWAATTPTGKTAVMERFGFEEVLSLEEMIDDLKVRGAVSWRQRIDQLLGWSRQLFEYLGPGEHIG
jgi:hypothetical protein